MPFVPLLRAPLIIVVITIIMCIPNAATRHMNGAAIIGRCAHFSIQAGTAITFDGVETNVACGSVGVAPGTSITGISVLGTNYTKEANTVFAINCAADELIAYGYLKGVTCKNILANSDLSGVTLFPGVYFTGSGFLTLKATTLYLDARGNPNAIFIFQTATTLITSVNTNIVLLNGTRSKNIYWQVGSSATLGANSSFMGQIFAHMSITVGVTASVVGRLYAQAAVSFAGANMIKLPGHC
ncbi:unnamed protein product [Adineta steineri]|uniref:Uncharacterized protein n=1 Tax=Adineta steineri TaxID=433720 RepID=A0A813UKP6_9BILA|nr:unnamed protein product [Adineta steineri]